MTITGDGHSGLRLYVIAQSSSIDFGKEIRDVHSVSTESYHDRLTCSIASVHNRAPSPATSFRTFILRTREAGWRPRHLVTR